MKVKKGREVIEVKCLDVEKVRLLPAIFPPLYQLKLKYQPEYFLFNTTRSGAQVVGSTWDGSEMGTLIKKKKKLLGI